MTEPAYTTGFAPSSMSAISVIPTPGPFGTVMAPFLISRRGLNQLLYFSTFLLYSWYGPMSGV